MKTYKFLGLMVIGVGLASCVPHVMQTAEISPGNSLIISGGYSKYYFTEILATEHYGSGICVGFSGRYTFKRSQRLGILTDVGLFTGKGNDGITIFPENDLGFYPYGAVGLQWEFIEKPSLACRFNIEFPWFINGTLLCGISSSKIGREVVTFGVGTVLYYPNSLFITIHPSSKLHLSVNVIPMYLRSKNPKLSFFAGVGYSISKESADSKQERYQDSRF